MIANSGARSKEAMAAKQRMAEIEISLTTELAERMQTDAQGAVVDLLGAVKKLPEAEQAAALKNYFGEESVAAIAPLLTQLDLLKKHFNMVGDASLYAGSMEKEFTARADTSENSFALLKNAVKELSDTFGKIFVPSAESGMNALTEKIYRVTDFVKANPELIKTLTTVAASLAGLKVAGLGAKLGFLEIKGGILEAQSILALFKGNVAENAAAAATGGGKIAEIGKSLKGYFGGIGKSADALSGGGLSKLSGLFSKISGLFKNMSSTIGAVLGGPLKGLSSLFGGLFGKVMPVIAIVSLLATLFVKLNGGDISKFIEPLKTAFEDVKPTLETIMGNLTKLGQDLMPLLMDAAEKLAPLFFEIVAEILPVAVSLFQALMPVISVIGETILPVLLNALTELMPLFTTLITTILPVIKELIDALVPVIEGLATVFASVFKEGIKAAVDAIKPIIENLITIFEGLMAFITGVFTGDWKKAWEGVKDIFGGIFGGLVELVKAPFRLIVGVINGVIEGLNKLKVPDWIPGIGGKGINITPISTFQKGTNYTPDTFIAGDVNGKGGELITGARGRKVFTAAETTTIFDNINRAKAINSINPAPSALNVPVRGGGQSFTIEYNPTIYVDGGKPGNLEEKLRQNNEDLMEMFKDFLRQQQDNEKRMVYV